MRHGGLGRAVPLVAAVAALALGATPSTSAAQGCGTTDEAAATAPEGAVRAAVRCLVNAERARHGMPALHASARLNVAAERHSADMVERRYFAHVTPDGRSVADRVRRTGYLGGSADWALGEDIGWGTGELSSAAAIVQAWMNSPPHRHVILTRGFHDIGVGIARGVPVDGQGAGATFVLDLGDTD